MSRSDKSTAASKPSQLAYYGGAAWAFLAAMYFLTQNTGNPDDSVYQLVTAIFEIVAFFAASLLCFRNVMGTNSVSGKDVWLGLGLGLANYCVGSCLYAYWEVGLGQTPDITPGDLFYVLAYVFLLYGMVMAVIKRNLNLELIQWVMVMVVGVLGIVFALFVSTDSKSSSSQSFNLLEVPAIAASAPAQVAQMSGLEVAQAPSIAPSAKPTAKPTATATPKPEVTKTPVAVPSAPVVPLQQQADPAPEKPIPAWVKSIDNVLAPHEKLVQWIYVVGDVCLIVIATALLTAFWGGRFSQSWQFIAFAGFSFYIADMWVKYATKVYPSYSSGGLPEVFYVFAGVLFGIGAALEYDLSRSRRSSRRRG